MNNTDVARLRAAGLCPEDVTVVPRGQVTFAQDGTAYVEATITVPPLEPCPTCGQEMQYNEKEK